MSAERHPLAAPTQAWSEALTRQIMGEVKRRRDALGLRAQDLADRAEDIGIYLPRGVIAKLESGERKQITLPEILSFAAVLGTAPALLIAPLASPQPVEVLPAKVLSAIDAYVWLTEGRGNVGVTTDFHHVDWADQAVRDFQSIDLLNAHRHLYPQIQNLHSRANAVRRLRRDRPQESEHWTAELRKVSEQADDLWTELLKVRDAISAGGFQIPHWAPEFEERAQTEAEFEMGQPWGFEPTGRVEDA